MPTPVRAMSLRAASSSVVATWSSSRTARARARESKTSGTVRERKRPPSRRDRLRHTSGPSSVLKDSPTLPSMATAVEEGQLRSGV